MKVRRLSNSKKVLNFNVFGGGGECLGERGLMKKGG